VRTELRRAGRIVRVRRRTPHCPVVRGRDLLDPLDRAGFEIHGDERIRARLRRVRIAVPRGNVYEPALHIDGGRSPDATTGRAVELDAALRLTARTRLVDGVRFPEHFAVVRVQRDDTAAER